jgi:hypothetical protein
MVAIARSRDLLELTRHAVMERKPDDSAQGQADDEPTAKAAKSKGGA